MKLPNYEDAYIDDRKLIDYCLNEYHDTGKHKAVVFKAALGLTADSYLSLRQEILKAVKNNDCVEADNIGYGKLYTVDFEMRNLDKRASVRTSWIIKTDENFPRLVSCYVKT